MRNTFYPITCALLAILLSMPLRTQADEVPSATDYPWQLALLNSDAQEFQLSDYRGQTLLLSFFYTTCGYACPIQTAQLAKVQKLLELHTLAASKFLSVSIHPQTDTPERLDAFVRPHNIDTQHWHFGVPTDKSVLQAILSRAGVSTAALEDPGQTDHTMKILLIDPTGLIRQRYIGNKFDIQRLATEVATVVRLHSGS